MCGKDVTRYNEDIDFSDVDTQFVCIRTFVWILIRPFVCSENFHQQVKENYKHWDFIRNVFGLFYFMFMFGFRDDQKDPDPQQGFHF